MNMQHFWFNIIGHFDDTQIMDFLVKNVPENGTIAEIGVWRGRSTAYLGVEALNSGKNIQIDAIDLWFTPDSGYISPEEFREKNPEADIYNLAEDSMYVKFIQNMKDLRNVRPIKMCSWEAASIYADNSLDAVYIDGDHIYESVKKDIHAWYDKVKPGGILSGHDIFNCLDVPKAVKECFGDSYNTLNTSWWIQKK